MPGSALGTFIAQLERDGELVRIPGPLDPRLEIAALTRLACREPDGGPALLFDRPLGASFPVATNLFGSVRRVTRALGTAPAELTARMTGLLDQLRDPDYGGLDRHIAALADFAGFNPTCTWCPDPDLILQSPVDLTVFPFLQGWPDDGSHDGFPRYLTLPQIYSESPEGGGNCGLYRVQLRGRDELAIRWKEGSGAARHAARYAARRERMPVAVALGGDPALLFSALFPLPGELDETAFAGFLRRKPFTRCDCLTVPLRIPVGMELVIEGYVEPGDQVMEGPFGNHTGFYSPAAPAARMKVTVVRYRGDAVVPATVVGPPPMEDCWMAQAWERILAAFLRRLVPGVSEIHLPREWVFHQSAIISLDNPSPAMVRECAGRLWQLPWFGAARLLVFVDSATAPDDMSAVSWRGINLLEYDHDIIFDTSGTRLALDATGSRRTRPALFDDREALRRAGQVWEFHRRQQAA